MLTIFPSAAVARAEQRVGVFPAEHGDPRLLPHVEIAEVAPHERLDVVDHHVIGHGADHLAREARRPGTIIELPGPPGAHGRQRSRAIAQELRIMEGEPLDASSRALGCAERSRSDTMIVPRPPTSFRNCSVSAVWPPNNARTVTMLAVPRMSPEQRQQRLTPVAARFVESGEQRLDEIHTTRPSLI